MPIRLSGINSGLDTDALVKELVSAYSLKTQKYEKQQTKLEWKKDAWQGLNTKIYGLYTNISNLRYDSAYNLKRTSVSDATKAKVTASSEAVTGTQKLEILATAQASYVTGGKLADDITANSTLADLGYTGGETTIEVRTKSGTTKEINLTADTKISDIVAQLKEAGLNANFDVNNKRFFVSAKESGEANDFDLCATDENSQKALEALKLNMSLVEKVKVDGKETVVFTSAGAAYQDAYELYEAATKAGQDVETYLKTLVDGYSKDLKNQEQIVANNKSTIEEYEDLVAHRDARKAHGNLYSVLSKEGMALSSAQIYDISKKLYKAGEISEKDVETYLKDNNITLPEGKSAKDLAEVLNANKADMKKVKEFDGNVLSKKLADLETAVADGKEAYDAAVEATKAANDKIAQINASDYAELAKLDPDTLQKEIDQIVTRANDAVAMMNNPQITENGAIKIAGQDAEIRLNGATYTSANNSFSINGLTIEAQAVTAGEISITTAVDTQGIYDKIKDFLTEYNNVINEITKLYNAESSGDYEPLTDEEKDAMSDTQIEKWENKIKDALLRRDSSLGAIMNAMTSAMSQSIEVGGQKLSLGNFGISTLGFLNAAKNEQYAYHIDGDEDDAKTSGNPDKLMKAIQENPDQILDFMKQLTTNLYNAIDSKMKSTELSSAYKVYNDKEMDKELSSVEQLIKKWEEKVAKEEDYYYNKFSDMEVALSKLQSQTNSIAGLLGQ